MATTGFGFCLVISVMATILFALKNDDRVNSYDWSISFLLPFIIMGYWLKTQTASQEAALILFVLINLSSTVLLAVILFSMLRHVRIPVDPWIKFIVYGAPFTQLVPVWMTFRGGMPEDLIQITDTGDGYSTRMIGGSFAFSYITFLLALLIVIIGVVGILQARKRTYSHRTLAFYLSFVFVGILIYALESLLNMNFSAIPYLYMTGDIVLVLTCDQARSRDISRLISDNQKAMRRGYVAIGLNGWFLCANEQCFDYLPDLKKQRADAPIPADSPAGKNLYSVIENYNANGITTATFRSGEKTFAYEIAPFSFRRGDLPQGYLIDIRDATEETRNMEILSDFNTRLNQEVAEKTLNVENMREKLVGKGQHRFGHPQQARTAHARGICHHEVPFRHQWTDGQDPAGRHGGGPSGADSLSCCPLPS